MTARSDRTLAITSCLYLGRVVHTRLRPFLHSFRYRVFSMLIDLDDLPQLDGKLRFFAHNRRGLFSFHDADHGPRDGTALRPWLDAQLDAAGADWPRGRVRLLCFPRLFGYVFNPLSIWFCSDRDGRLRAILYEVKNTFGEQHCYLLDLPPDHPPGSEINQHCAKGFYVSPFIDMDCSYAFRLREPDERLSVLIRQSDRQGELLLASQSGQRAALTDLQLLKAFFAYPLMTVKVIAAIHWEALWLWAKGARLRRRPPAPDAPVTSYLTRRPSRLEAAE